MDQVHQTCIELLSSRGYTIKSETEGGDNEFQKIVGDSTTKELICVFIVPCPINVKTVETLISTMHDEGMKTGIVVYYNRITPYAKNVIESSEDVTLELFSERELRFNITKHSYVPKHELVLPSDKDYAYLRDVAGKLPKLLQTDAVARFYGYCSRDIIRVTRKDGSIAHRTVVAC